MDFEKEIFSDKIIHYDELINYGFIIKNQNYVYCKKIMDDIFEVKINISKSGKITGKVFETEFGDEYLGLRIVDESGKFAHQIQEEYKKILIDIAEKCCNKQYFYTKQANRIADWIIKEYNIKPNFPWKKLPRYGVFELPENEKIFVTILNVERKEDDKNSKKCEEINVRIEKDYMDEMLSKKGVYTSYYKTNENWIAIVLDNTFTDDEIKNYIKESYVLTIAPNAWIVPANPQYFDIVSYLEHNNKTVWRQVRGAKKGDYIYIYLAKPYSAILYKCQIININIPYKFENENLKITKAMEMKVLERYDEKEYPFSKLKEYGVNFLRGPVKMPDELKKEMNTK